MNRDPAGPVGRVALAAGVPSPKGLVPAGIVPKPATCYAQGGVNELILAAVALLEAAQERVIALDETGAAYDWPAEEARLMALAGLESALDNVGVGLALISTATQVLPSVAVGAPRGTFSAVLGEALRAAGVSIPGLDSMAAWPPGQRDAG